MDSFFSQDDVPICVSEKESLSMARQQIRILRKVVQEEADARPQLRFIVIRKAHNRFGVFDDGIARKEHFVRGDAHAARRMTWSQIKSQGSMMKFKGILQVFHEQIDLIELSWLPIKVGIIPFRIGRVCGAGF